MKSSQTFSLNIECYQYTWNIHVLQNAVKNKNIEAWKIPESFLKEWTWGEDKIEMHLNRCLDADLNYPIIVWDNIIVDGCHRVVKSLALGKKEILSKQIVDMPPPCIITDVKLYTDKENIRHTFNDIVILVKEKLKGV